jgi:hypothetical protein
MEKREANGRVLPAKDYWSTEKDRVLYGKIGAIKTAAVVIEMQ